MMSKKPLEEEFLYGSDNSTTITNNYPSDNINSPRGYLKFKKNADNYIKEKEESLFMSDKSKVLLKENLKHKEFYSKSILKDAYYIIKLKEFNKEEITQNTEKEIQDKLMEPEKRIKINDKILPKMLGNDEAKKDAHMKN